MAKEIYVRTPESNRTIQDDDLKAANVFELPVITADNEDDQRPGCVGIKEGTPHYHNGTEMVPIGIAPPIDTMIFTQADLVDDGGGGWYLPLSLTGSQITAAVKSSKGFIRGGGEIGNINGFTDASPQKIWVFVMGKPALKYFKLGGNSSLSGISGTISVLMDGDIEVYSKSVSLISTAETIEFPDDYSGSITVRNTSTSNIQMSGLLEIPASGDRVYNPGTSSYILTGITTILSV